MRTSRHPRSAAHRGLCWAVVCLCTPFLIAFGIAKEGFFIDELFSFGIANSDRGPFINETAKQNGGLLRHDDIVNYLTANREDRFDYGNVIENAGKDTGAPLYYLLLHTVSSLFPCTWNKWHALSINFFFYILSLFAVRGIAVAIYRKETSADAAMLLFGLSPLTLSMFLMARMYTMLTFLSLAIVWLFICMFQHGVRPMNALLTLLTVVAGIATHYLFIYLTLSLILLSIFYPPHDRNRIH